MCDRTWRPRHAKTAHKHTGAPLVCNRTSRHAVFPHSHRQTHKQPTPPSSHNFHPTPPTPPPEASVQCEAVIPAMRWSNFLFEKVGSTCIFGDFRPMLVYFMVGACERSMDCTLVHCWDELNRQWENFVHSCFSFSRSALWPFARKVHVLGVMVFAVSGLQAMCSPRCFAFFAFLIGRAGYGSWWSDGRQAVFQFLVIVVVCRHISCVSASMWDACVSLFGELTKLRRACLPPPTHGSAAILLWSGVPRLGTHGCR